jgi:hypothetical protein
VGQYSGELGIVSMATEIARREIDEERAAVLLGLTTLQLREWSEHFGPRDQAADETSERTFFTYEELYQLCRWVTRPEV